MTNQSNIDNLLFNLEYRAAFEKLSMADRIKIKQDFLDLIEQVGNEIINKNFGDLKRTNPTVSAVLILQEERLSAWLKEQKQ